MERLQLTCDKCGYTYKPRKENVLMCPRCKTRFDYRPKPKIEYICKRCENIFYSSSKNPSKCSICDDKHWNYPYVNKNHKCQRSILKITK